MQNFVQYAPTEVVFGRGVENQAGALVKKYHASRVLVVYGGKSAKESGLLDTICKSLEAEGRQAESQDVPGEGRSRKGSFLWCGDDPGGGRRKRH